MTEAEELMKEWFALKSAQTAKKRELVKFHETYECQNMQSNGYMEEPIQCIYRAEFGRPVKDICEPCGTRHNFYMQRQENARRRTAILNKVRHILAITPTPNKKGK
jgi:hypothetical protein